MGYFISLLISRVGSIIIAPLLFLFTSTSGKSYKEYINASKNDEKIDELLTDRNMYRSIVTEILIILILKSIKLIFLSIDLKTNLVIIILLLLIVIFSISFLKHNKVIINRIESSKK